MSIRRPWPSRDESGSAMIIALIVMTVTVTLSLAAATEAVHGASATALDRNQVQAISLAEAGVDQALRDLQGQTNLPCSASTPTLPLLNLATTPVAGTAAVSLSYYDTFPPSGSPDTNCINGVQGGNPQGVEITSSGQIGNSSIGKATMSALVRLTPYLPDAIYANSFTVGNSTELLSQPGQGNNANVYVENSSGGTVACPNSTALYGTLYVDQGGISLDNNCHVYGSVWANGDVSAGQNTAVDGQISSTTGNITFNGSYANGALAAGTITPACPSPSVFKTCAAQATVGPVPTQSFPQMGFQLSSWTNAGFTPHDDSTWTSCPAVNSDLQAMVPTTKTVFVAPAACSLSGEPPAPHPLSVANNATLTTGADLAVIAPDGFSTGQHFAWASTSTTVHHLYLVVPYNQSTTYNATTCSSQYNLDFGNSASFTNLSTLLYTPCNLTSGNSAFGAGQIYVGQKLDVGNTLDLTFQPEIVPGVTGSVAYNAAMSYERQLTH